MTSLHWNGSYWAPEGEVEPAIDAPAIDVQTKVKVGVAEGYACKRCNGFNEHAELNVPEDKPSEYWCYACRKGL